MSRFGTEESKLTKETDMAFSALPFLGPVWQPRFAILSNLRKVPNLKDKASTSWNIYAVPPGKTCL